MRSNVRDDDLPACGMDADDELLFGTLPQRCARSSETRGPTGTGIVLSVLVTLALWAVLAALGV